jgi:hypothetical protein
MVTILYILLRPIINYPLTLEEGRGQGALFEIRNEPLKSCKNPEKVGRKECLHPCLQTEVKALLASNHIYIDV